MQRDPEKYLFDMQDSCRFVLELTAGRTLDEFRNNREFRSAIERELQIVGEAPTRLGPVDVFCRDNKIRTQFATEVGRDKRSVPGIFAGNDLRSYAGLHRFGFY